MISRCHIPKGSGGHIEFLLPSSVTQSPLSGTAWGALTTPSIACIAVTGAGIPSAIALSNTPTEIGATGVWYLQLTAAESNYDRHMISFQATEIITTAVIVECNAPTPSPTTFFPSWGFRRYQ